MTDKASRALWRQLQDSLVEWSNELFAENLANAIVLFCRNINGAYNKFWVEQFWDRHIPGLGRMIAIVYASYWKRFIFHSSLLYFADSIILDTYWNIPPQKQRCTLCLILTCCNECGWNLRPWVFLNIMKLIKSYL